MATYATLKNGSRGDDVKKMQESLRSAGYDVGDPGTDGIYGNITEAAVKKYQQDNGLTVDGIAGDETLSKLYGSAASGSGTGAGAGATNGFQYKDYAPSDTVQQALDKLNSLQKPQTQESQWLQGLNDTIRKILNREKFSYDLNGDALYQQYKDQYIQGGKMAMQDAIGQAASMTGGYGNSWAQSVGQQAYQGYMQQLTDKIPELYQLALDKYTREGEELYNQYGLLTDADARDYQKYRDSVADYYADKELLTNDYRYESEMDLNKHFAEKDFNYGVYRDKIADNQWQTQFDEAKRQFDSKLVSPDLDEGEDIDYDNEGLNSATIKAMQKYYGVTADGKWGELSKEAAGGLSAKEAWDKWQNGGDVDYSSWEAADWQSYFAQIRQKEGQDAAEEELEYFTSKGLIPKNMTSYAASGARGGRLGH